MTLKHIIIFGLFTQLHFIACAQSIFDDCEIYTKWTPATIVLNSGDTITRSAKYNPLVNERKIELKEQENFSYLETKTVKELSYFDNNLKAPRIFKNIKIYASDLQNKMNVFSEIYFENKYFAITRSVSYEGSHAFLNPLGKPSYGIVVFIVNKMTGKPFKSVSKKTFITAMSGKEPQIREYIKRMQLKLFAFDDQIKVFEYYAALRDGQSD